MRVDRDPAAVIGNGQRAVGIKRHLDPRGVARDGFVHAVVENFRGEMVQRALVDASDVHAGAATHRLEAFEHFDMPGVVVGRGRGAANRSVIRRYSK